MCIGAHLEATHLVDTVAVVLLYATVVTRLPRARAFLQVLLVILEIVHRRRRPGDGFPRPGSSAGPGALIALLYERVRIKYLGDQQTRPSR